MYDRVTDRSRGFAFVTMAGVEEAKAAIRMFNGSVSSFLTFSDIKLINMTTLKNLKNWI